MENNGWIKLHRKLLDNPICKKPEWAWTWIVLLLLANHEDNSFIFNGTKITVSRGQFITGRLELSKITRVKPTTLERILNYLESEHQIGQQKTNKYRLITVLKYNDYQEIGQQTDNKRTTNGQQTDTNKNVKNDKNEKKEKRYTSQNLTLEEVSQKVVEVFNNNLGTKYKYSEGINSNLEYWLKTYEPKEMEQAIQQIKYDKFWRDKMTPTMLFRRKNPQGEPVDYISQLLVKNNNE